jgi:beta-mannosidase
MKNSDRRKFLGQGAALCGSTVLAACGGGGDRLYAGIPSASGGNPPDAGAPPVAPPGVAAQPALAAGQLDTNWTLVDLKGLSDTAADVSRLGYVADAAKGWVPATVPGTVLTSMVNNKTCPEPFYAKITTKAIPDTLWQTDYWYRTAFDVPLLAPGQRLWLQFDGINYIAEVWLNGTKVGTIEGAFRHGYFDVTGIQVASAGQRCDLAVRISPPPNSEDPLQPSYQSGVTRGGRNGGPSGKSLRDGPAFFCSSGWDWLPTIPDRESGLWRPVSWFTTGPVRIEEDLRIQTVVAADLSRADIHLSFTLDNGAGEALTGTVTGEIGGIQFRYDTTVPAGAKQTVALDPKTIPALSLAGPKLWWPNGSGDPSLHTLNLGFEIDGVVSDRQSRKFGVRKIEYTSAGTGGNVLAIVVNNRPIFIKGGNWGLDEALKRIPRQRIFNQVRLHRDANLNLIRNWAGQNANEDFYAACDAYGILVWNDFFSSSEGPPADNVPRYLDNVRDVIVHYRNHPSILLWCGANEGLPPDAIYNGVGDLIKTLDPDRLYLGYSGGKTGSAEPDGFSSGGPYHWVTPSQNFSKGIGSYAVPFRNEIGSYSIPTLEFVQSMLPRTSWECPDDFWADRDVNANGGNGGGAGYIATIGARYGAIVNLADFVRKAQLANFECIKAIYESYAASMLVTSSRVSSPTTGVVMWMTNPAQPSFVWQMYSHDLELHSSFFAVKRGCESVCVVMDAATFELTVVNQGGKAIGGSIDVRVLDLNGVESARAVQSFAGVAMASCQDVGNIKASIQKCDTDVCFVSLKMSDANGAPLSSNFYWLRKDGDDGSAGDGYSGGDYSSMDAMPAAAVSVAAQLAQSDDVTSRIGIQVANTGTAIALMLHLQLFDSTTGSRILPAFYSDNYLNLLPGASTELTIEVPHEAGKPPKNAAIRIDGWKLDRQNSRLGLAGVPVIFNENAMAVTGTKTFGACSG